MKTKNFKKQDIKDKVLREIRSELDEDDYYENQ